ncbi:helix-turn-helix domain-containing protein [Saccharopolyspora sp. K220]|uniref:GlxA family transcriptional regulator n=1 Tax=Saccharopolyspora soli TaxID=2926618 RepID=UPI001F5A42AF|nr:helix-turn-helix domain-containing protein [Saccharopolyspora soli]MCI2415965.1 helix-turn-helix domain-containing protein [Saccharopolyspora soli]
MHDVLVPLLTGYQPLDVTGPHEVFSVATALLAFGGGSGGYAVRIAAAEPGAVAADSGLGLVATEALPERGPIGTLLVPGGMGVRRAGRDAPEFVEWLRRAAPRAERVVSVCTGAFPLAAAGLLDGLTSTTHWRWAGSLAREYPTVQVRPDAIYLREGRVWTSGGVTAGIDVALALVEADHGPELAQQVARELLVFVRRPGGQSQFAAPAWAPPAQRSSVRAAQDLIHADPSADLRVPELARQVGMSVRHFTREFNRALGQSPAEYVEHVRVDAARRLLESEPVLVTVAAARCGFGSAETMRRAFLRRLGVPPDHYRRHFATQP